MERRIHEYMPTEARSASWSGRPRAGQAPCARYVSLPRLLCGSRGSCGSRIPLSSLFSQPAVARIPPSPPSASARGPIQRELRRDGVADMMRSRPQRSAVLLQQGRVAELSPRCCCRVRPRHPLRDESVGKQRQVFLDLVPEFTRVLLSAQEPAHLRGKRLEPGLSTRPHGFRPCSRRSTRPITPEMRSQFWVSASSCFSPRLVME